MLKVGEKMKRLIIESVSIISPDIQKAKYQEFKSGINVIVGDKIKGNFIGKSSLLRSVFHSLGADAKFAKDDWEKEGPYIYITEFKVGDKKYTILRKQELFRLFDENNTELFTVINREDLSKRLNELFFKEVYLLTHQQSYSLAHPVYNYLLNYIEQKEIHLCEFRSFNSLTAFHGSYYSDLLYSLLGVDSKEYSNAVTTKKELESDLKLKQDAEKSLLDMLNIINSKSNKELSLDEIKALRDALTRFEEQYTELASQANKTKTKLYEAYNAKAELENLVKDIRYSLEDTEKTGRSIIKEHICPICHNELQDTSNTYFENSNEVQNYSYQLLDVEKDLANIEREIQKLLVKYEEYLNLIKDIEIRVFDNKSEISDKLELIGLRKIKSNINNEINQTKSDIIKINSDIEAENIRIRNLKKLRSDVDKFYLKALYDISLDYDIRIPALSKINKVDQKFQVDGNQIMIATVAWLCSLLKTKYEFNKTSLVLPLIYDNPNNANFDAENDYKIFKLLFDNLPEKGQIVTSCVGFEEEKYSEDFDINIINLTNPQYELLNSNDYQNCLEKLNRLR